MNFAYRAAIVLAFVMIYGVIEARAADEWDRYDYALAGAALTTLAVDWRQSRTIAKNPHLYHETNPLLGKHPSVSRVDNYFLGAMVGTVAVAHVLPSKWRKAFLGGVVLVEVSVIGRNKSLGIRADW